MIHTMNGSFAFCNVRPLEREWEVIQMHVESVDITCAPLPAKMCTGVNVCLMVNVHQS